LVTSGGYFEPIWHYITRIILVGCA